MKTKWNTLTILALLVMLLGGNVTSAQAAEGDLDPTFGTGGVLATDTSTFFGWFFTRHASTQQSDGKIIVGGYYLPAIAIDVSPQAELARYSADGVLDGDFGAGGKIHPQAPDVTVSYVSGVHTGPEDEIIAVGGYGDYGISHIYLARYDGAGEPVAGFGTEGVLPVALPADWTMALPFDSALQSDGMLLVAGMAMIPNETGNSQPASFLIRLDPADGTLDPTFGSEGMVLILSDTYAFHQITLQSDGKILVTNAPGSASFIIHRFTSTGVPDEGFGTNGVLETPMQFQCSELAEGPGGKLYLTVGPIGTSDSGSEFFLARLSADGSPDPAFGTLGTGSVFTDFASGSDQSCSLLVQADGKVIVGGGATDADGNPGLGLARYTVDGALDESFGSGGKVITTGLWALITELAVTPGGKLLATGIYSDGTNFYTSLARYDLSGGTTDNTPPFIAPDIQGTLGQNNWYTSDVILSWTVEDAESTFATNGCETVTIDIDQEDTIYICAASSDGGLNSVTVHIQRDATAPTLESFVSPDTVVLNGSAIAYLNSYDATSDVASASCDPVDTSSVGTHSVTCTATDNAGNTATASATYSVTYDFIGFTSPVDNPDVMNIAKAGQTIPLKFRVTDANSNPITNLTSVTVMAVSLPCTAETITDPVEEYAAGSSGLQNLGDGYYQWNWKTPITYANSCKTIRLDLGEGIFHTALFQFRR